MVKLIIICVVFAVIYCIVVLIGMIGSRNEQIEGMLRYEDDLLEEAQSRLMESIKTKRQCRKDAIRSRRNAIESMEHQRKVIQELRLQMMELQQDNQRMKAIDAKNVGLYYKIIDLSNENSDLKDKIKKLSKK